MDRRRYLKSLVVGTTGAGLLLQSCKDEQPKEIAESAKEFTIDRTPDELARERKLMSEKFFNEHEMATITILSDIIIPKDEVSGSASDAKVPDFIEFIAKDRPEHQLPLRGGIKWLDLQCLKRFKADFATCKSEDQIAMVDLIAFPEKAAPDMSQGVAFFNLMRDLTATGFFTSKIGLADLGYQGNKPNQWDGVPKEVLDQFGLKYDERTIEISPKFS
jgi:gluconate 2-dehydrogenase gamma chain